MLRNPISYIFKLGKHPSLQLRPLMQLSDKIESPSSPLPSAQLMLEAPHKRGQLQHSNQMSS